MARIKWVVQKLENWSRWCCSSDRGALGYPTQAAFTRLGVRGHRGEAQIPLLPLVAEETDRAVRSLRPTHPHLFMVLQLHYAKNVQDIFEVARRMGRTQDTVKRNLEEADHALARWFQEQDEVRARRRAMYEARTDGPREVEVD